MIKKLELDTLKAEVASLDYLISERSVEDPIGARQFIKRREKLLEKIATVNNAVSSFASVGLFFGGAPVFGSKGIDSHFASNIIDKFQSIVNKRYAFLESGTLSSRGPVRNSNNAKLMISDVARGSFGFVLEEAPKDSLLEVDTELKHVVEDVNDILNKISSPEDSVFEEVIEDLDDRTLNDVRSFYEELYSSQATLKVIDDRSEYILSLDKIFYAKNRMDRVRFSDETMTTIFGRLYVVPYEKRFELRVEGRDAPIRGKITKQFLESHSNDLDSIIGRDWNAQLLVTDIYRNDVLVSTRYTLDSISQ
ncbi:MULTISPECIES: hypothetical protein [Raoultella]|uniref:hypothetical protein n=1 Tax=Raoultella TaxID=160674 RepID=UPI002E0EF790|nr:hypothetical protein Q1L34_16375 [Raoultella ornithinolytica]